MKRTYRYDPETREMVEVENRYTPVARCELQMDISPFKSPIDGSVIGSRKDLREHMKRHDVVLADDFTEHRKKKQAERDARTNGTHPEVRRERIQQACDAYERVRNEHKARGIWRS